MARNSWPDETVRSSPSRPSVGWNLPGVSRRRESMDWLDRDLRAVAMAFDQTARRRRQFLIFTIPDCFHLRPPGGGGDVRHQLAEGHSGNRPLNAISACGSSSRDIFMGLCLRSSGSVQRGGMPAHYQSRRTDGSLADSGAGMISGSRDLPGVVLPQAAVRLLISGCGLRQETNPAAFLGAGGVIN